jgi:hypothetical protein
MLIMTLGGANQTLAQYFNIAPHGVRFGGSKTQAQQYNPETVTMVTGQVEDPGSYGMTGWRVAPGMETQGLILKTDKDRIAVDLGPAWYVNQQDFKITKGDTLEVTGSKISRNEKTVMLASEAKKDGKTLKVRDEKGSPLWREQSRGGRGSGSQVNSPRGASGRHMF